MKLSRYQSLCCYVLSITLSTQQNIMFLLLYKVCSLKKKLIFVSHISFKRISITKKQQKGITLSEKKYRSKVENYAGRKKSLKFAYPWILLCRQLKVSKNLKETLLLSDLQTFLTLLIIESILKNCANQKYEK